MKSFLTFLFAQVSFSNLSELVPESISERKFSNVAQFAYLKSNTTLDYTSYRKLLQNYGCHCFPLLESTTSPSARLLKGEGPPVDEMDRYCKELSQCHACVRKDFKNTDTEWGKYRVSLVK